MSSAGEWLPWCSFLHPPLGMRWTPSSIQGGFATAPVTSDDLRPSQLAYGPTDFRRASSHLPGEGADLRRNVGAASRRPHRCWRRCFTSRAAAAPHGGVDRHALGWWFGRFPAGGAPPAGVDRRDVDASGRVKGSLARSSAKIGDVVTGDSTRPPEGSIVRP